MFATIAPITDSLLPLYNGESLSRDRALVRRGFFITQKPGVYAGK